MIQTHRISMLADYEQQRKDLMRKYGIDLEDGTASQGFRNGRNTTGTRRMTQKQIDMLMGSPENGNVFTWRDQNRRKVRYYSRLSQLCVGN